MTATTPKLRDQRVNFDYEVYLVAKAAALEARMTLKSWLAEAIEAKAKAKGRKA